MIGSLNSGVGAMLSFVKGIEVTGSNIANVNTVGYKGARTRFEEALYTTLQRGTNTTGPGAITYSQQLGAGTKIASIANQFSQGALQTTGGQNDLGISGDGFFRVRDINQGIEYVTRAGDLRVDENGFLVTNNGLRVQGIGLLADDTDADTVPGDGIPDGIPDGTFDVNTALDTDNVRDVRIDYRAAAGDTRTISSYQIDQRGNINIFLSDGSSMVRGRIILERFQDLGKLTKVGNNLYTGMEAAGTVGNMPAVRAQGVLSVAFTDPTDYQDYMPTENGGGSIIVGTLELSNVDLTEEFASLITNQRAFQAASKLITTSDEILQEIVNLKR